VRIFAAAVHIAWKSLRQRRPGTQAHGNDAVAVGKVRFCAMGVTPFLGGVTVSLSFAFLYLDSVY
jgi:hypothetical protein